MADADKSREKQILHLLHYWLLDLACHKAFVELTETKCVTNTDFIQGVLTMPQDNLDAKIQVHLLLLMCKVTNGENYSTCYVPNSDLTVLEEVLSSFDEIIKSFDKSSDIRKCSSKYRIAIMKQAVYVCCRAGDFQKAKTVFDRQWSDLEGAEKSQKSAVLSVIKSKTSDHQTLKTQDFESFIDHMITFLQQVVDKFPDPFLLKVAKAYIETGEKTVNEHHSPRKKRRMNLQDFKNLPSVNLSSSEQEDLQRKVDKIRKKTVNSLVSAARGNANNSNTEQEINSISSMDSHSEESDTESISPSKVAESARRTTERLKERTKNLKRTVESMKEKSCESESSMPVKSPRGNTDGTPLNRTNQKSDDSSSELSPEKTPKRGGSKATLPDSSSKNIRNFHYKKNNNRVDRHATHPTASDSSNYSGISDGESSDEFSGKKFQLVGRPKVRRSLQPGSYSPHKHGSRRVFWTTREEEDFFLAVETYGVGNWAEIKKVLKTSRTSVNLKDKWRQLVNSGKAKTLQKLLKTNH